MSEARPAATVILLRDGAEGIETWLLRRVRQMSFAADMSVFPGGRIDEADGSADVPWVGDEPAAVAARLGCSVPQARASLVAATRETFEETGVLVTSPVYPGDEAPLAAMRRDVEARRVQFGTFLADAGLSVDANLIRPWSRWITPEPEPRRFDTHFYVAALPEAAVAQADSSEATHAEWIRPADALSEFHGGDRPLLPPTVVSLQELSPFGCVADVLAASEHRSLDAIRPTIEQTDDGHRRVVMPDGTVHPFPRRPDRPGAGEVR